VTDDNRPDSSGPPLRRTPLPRTTIVESIYIRIIGITLIVVGAMLADIPTKTRAAIVLLCLLDLAVALVWRHLWARNPRFPIVRFSAAEGIAIATAIAYVEPEWSVVALFAYLTSVAYLGALTGRVWAFAGGVLVIALAVVREATLPDADKVGWVPITMFASAAFALVAYANASSFAQARTSASLERLHEALRTVTSQPELKPTLDSIMAAARSAIRGEMVIIHLREGDHLVLAAGGLATDDWTVKRIERHTRWELASVDKTPLARAVNFGETVVVPNLLDDERFPEWVERFRNRATLDMARASVTVPLGADNEIVGAMVAFFRDPELADADTVRLLQTYAEHVTLLIVRTQAYDRERQLTERLREADRLKSEFVALASHQLRTPLTATKGFIDTVLFQWDRLDDGTRQNMVQRAAVSADELGRLLTQLLDLSRIESDDMHLDIHPLVVVDAVDEIVTSLTPLLRHEIVVDVAGDLVALADRDAFRHVVDNLLANAIKFSPSGTRISVCGSREHGEVLVEVVDQGPGIALEEQERIFERFYRASPSRDSSGGTGLGLAIAQRYVDALGGRIWVESELGAGATFVFALPEHRGPRDGLTPGTHTAKLDQPV